MDHVGGLAAGDVKHVVGAQGGLEGVAGGRLVGPVARREYRCHRDLGFSRAFSASTPVCAGAAGMRTEYEDCLPRLIVFRSASANGIAQTPTSTSR